MHARIAAALFIVAISAAIVSCSSSSSSASGPPADASGDGGCIDPVEGTACTSGETACPQDGNVCCIGYVWSCDATRHQWAKLGVGCACFPDDTGVDTRSDVADDTLAQDAGPFTCGSKTCGANQYCTDRPPGVAFDGSPPPDDFECADIPAACATTPTCDCIKSNVGAACSVTGCTADSSGHVTIGCMGV